MLVEYYNKILYPLQDRVIPLFRDTPFYLTGGTVLSRAYYNHRYSDDLDYFVNDRDDFVKIADRVISRLLNDFGDLQIAVKEPNFARLFVGSDRLKIEMINDVPAHVGAITEHPVLGRIDSKENILANKIMALIDRSLPKDVTDIYFLLKDGLSIKSALTDAASKAAGISPLLVAKVLSEFDYSLLESEIKWIMPVDVSAIGVFLRNIAKKIVEGFL